MFSISSHQRNPNHYKISHLTSVKMAIIGGGRAREGGREETQKEKGREGRREKRRKEEREGKGRESVGQDVEERGLQHVGGNIKWCYCYARQYGAKILKKSVQLFFKNLQNTTTMWASSLISVYLSKILKQDLKETSPLPKLITALLTTAKRR
jgi:hypothetical protein